MIVKDKYIKRYFFLSLLFLVLFTVIWKIAPYSDNPKKDKEKFQHNFLKLEQAFNESSTRLFQALEIDSLLTWDDLSSLVDKDSYTTYIFKNNKLVY